jgi:hypothetical protein
VRLGIVPIVEGESEVESVPVLLRRILEWRQVYDVPIHRPVRVRRNAVLREGEIERRIQIALTRGSVGGILVLLDADDDCPCQLGRALLQRCQRITRIPVVVVLANREFEAWFLGAKESLRGLRGMRADAASPSDPESIRGAKERLSRNMERGRRYFSTDDQPAFVARLDLDSARERCSSFAKLVRDIDGLVRAIDRDQTAAE